MLVQRDTQKNHDTTVTIGNICILCFAKRCGKNDAEEKIIRNIKLYTAAASQLMQLQKIDVITARCGSQQASIVVSTEALKCGNKC